MKLQLRDIEEPDIPSLLAVHMSDPGYLAMTEGSGGEPGAFDLGMLRRDWTIAKLMGRRMLGLFDEDELVGVADLLEDHPEQHVPWLGLILIHADKRRRGYGRDAAMQIFDELCAHGHRLVMASMIEANKKGVAFARAVGFHDDPDLTKQVGKNALLVFEKLL